MFLFKLLGYLILLCISKGDEEIVIEIPQGKLKGLKTSTALTGNVFYSFKGIPYAKPPVGLHKFDAPIAADPWVGELDATKHRSTCVFFCMIRKELTGDEDCLYINVYTPELNKDAKKSVMVFIHAGGFMTGSGDDDIYGPDFLIEQDVIVVTFNSRLGVAGFLNTGDENAPGNAGLKDQVMVLKWIKDNIKYFGGCPNKVTIFGVSSGAACVQFHLLSPMSRGLFRSAIAQSGSALNPWAMSYNHKDMAFKLGEAVGIKTTDTKELVDRLKEFTLQELVAASQEISKSLNHMNGHMSPFTPSIEPDVGQDIFLPNDPWLLLKADQIHDVPIMAGITLDETIALAPSFLANADMMNQHFEFFLPDDLNTTDARKTELGYMLRKFYFLEKPLTTNSKSEFVEMTSDIFFVAGICLSNKIIASRIRSPVYEYIFSYYSPKGVMKNLLESDEGVSHLDDLNYVFFSNAFKNNPQPGSTAEKMVKVMTKMWSNFAKEGNPTPAVDGEITTIWPASGEENFFLVINQTMKVEKWLFKDRINLWSQIYSEVLGDLAKLFL